MSNPDGRDLLTALGDEGLLEYGSHIPAAFVQKVLGIVVPRTGSKRTFEQLALQEMAAVDYVRNHLLNKGKYLSGAGGDYRILTVSENMRQVAVYMSSSVKKSQRGLKLLRTTPKEPGTPPDDMETRLERQKDAARTKLKDIQ